MHDVSINSAELQYIELIRVALSESTDDRRLRAIRNVKHDVVARRLEAMVENSRNDWMSDPANAKFVRWMATSATERHEAIYEFQRTVRRYESGTKGGNERKLNVAEQIGKLVLLTIRERKFRGVYSKIGILQQVREDSRLHDVVGAKGKETLSNIWGMYRGVVHLGMAMDLVQENPDAELNVLHLAESIRCDLCTNCPKGQHGPYVHSNLQISFTYKSMTSGTRFQNRGLSFGVD